MTEMEMQRPKKKHFSEKLAQRTREMNEIAAAAEGLDELDRGEGVEIDEALDKARAIVAAAEERIKLRRW